MSVLITNTRFTKYLQMVKFSHTIFSMPFAITGYFLAINATGSSFDLRLLLLVVLAVLFARNTAMAFNRITDYKIDALNPRTAQREIPAGKITLQKASIFVVINSIFFIATAWFINPLCFYLSPLALLTVMGYSYTKRFTSLAHLVLGMGLGLSPLGAWLAVTGYFALEPILLSFAVLFWVAGFDIIYALQDEKFDKEQGLNSIPAFLGTDKALMISSLLHLLSASLLILFSYRALPTFSYTGTFIFIALLIWQHLVVHRNGLAKVDLAFFTLNGIASLFFGLFAVIGLLI
ncbi:MAG: putative 4-hydroxybenzoate polyprenyltransferase [Sphingobacteriia bacterium]|nr:putative 4-hydroxybenzoate polyprenyltransferase [Sphingobacteriia bacterium]